MRKAVGPTLLGGLIVGAAALGGACGGTAPDADHAQVAAPSPTPMMAKSSCARQHPNVGASRHGVARESGVVTLADTGKSTVAYVADEDSQAIYTVDLVDLKQVAKTPLQGKPSQILVLADGRVAVALKDKSSLEILEPSDSPSKPLVSLCTKATPEEPLALAASPNDERLLVTSGWGHALTSFDAGSLDVIGAVDLPRDPRAVVVDDSGERAYVSHAVGSKVTVVDLGKDGKPRDLDLSVAVASPFSSGTPGFRRSGAQGFALAKSVENAPTPGVMTEGGKNPTGKAPTPQLPKPPAPSVPKGRIFVPMVTVDPGDPNVRSQAYYGGSRDGLPKEVPIVSVIDGAAERSLTRAAMSLGAQAKNECLLPRAAAFRASTGTLFVTCLGIDSLVEMDTRGADPARLEQRRWQVPSGPTGIAVDDRSGQAVVWSQFEGRLTVIDLDEKGADNAVNIPVDYSPTAEAALIARGRQIYHTTDDARISNDGVACASCHPDGRDDAFTWSTPEGPRQTIMLAGRSVNTAPYGWMGKHGNLQTYLGNTFTRLGGSGIQGAELESLITYIERMPAPMQRVEAGKESLDRGQSLFFDETVGCAQCHVEGAGVDKTTHDVGSKAVADNPDIKFDTPSLKFIRGTAPYFHDGRYKTLDEMLAAPDSQMGHTLQLNARQRADLANYLESL